ncbi:hypothetical protein OL229_05190 [Neisseriaceae bacterium JH1-16]|nr:hypothetical protein [Neisseriaceae bacterium JH1-16]
MGGKSSSRSDNSTTTNNTYQTSNADNRMTIGNGGLGVSGTGNSTTMNILDGGAVAGAIDLAKSGRQLASQDFGEVLNAGKYLIDQAYKNASDSRDAARETIKDVGQVYQQSRETELSKDTQSAKQLMTVGGMILVGVIAAKSLK